MGTPNIPFTAYVKLYPKRPGRRGELMRELQKLGYLIDQALAEVPTLQLATPGGGQVRNHSDRTDYAGGVAVKPQFGETPAQATIVGFWDNDQTRELPNPPTQPPRQLFSGGQVWTGDAGGQPWVQPTTTATALQVKELKYQLQSNIAAGIPGDIQFDIFRIDYAGEIWGDRGHHFPR